jgi:hypothetical protein
MVAGRESRWAGNFGNFSGIPDFRGTNVSHWRYNVYPHRFRVADGRATEGREDRKG